MLPNRLNAKESGEFIARKAQFIHVEELGVKNLAKQVKHDYSLKYS